MNKPSLFELSAFASAMSTSATPRVQPGNKLVRRKPSPLALEQRFMFDGAAVGDAVQMLASPSVDASAPADAPLADGHAAAADWLRFANVTVDSASPLAAAEIAAERLVAEFLQRPDAHEQLFSLFNGGQAEPSAEWQQAADSFLTAMQNGEVSVRVELRSNAELQGAKGAFSATGTTGQHTIYLNADWLAGNPDAGIGAADSASITKVLVEELGHSIDATLNGAVDTAGDEGEVFARVVVDGANPLSVSFLSAQDDRGQLTIDGQSVVAEFANLNFSNAYAMVYDLDNSGAIVGSTGETEAAKEQSSHNFNAASLGIATINDDTNSNLFSGNDVSAVGLNIGGTTYYGWISRPIKSGGVIRGFYFWTDPQFVNLATAQADGNQDGDSNALDNKGFLLVVDQTWFTSQISSTATTVSTAIDNTSLRTYSNVKSSSDRVDSALNALLAAQPVNTAPVANNDAANGTPGTSGGAALEQGYNSNTNTTITATVNATGNVLTNDVDTDGDTLTVSKIVSGSTGTTASVTGSTNVVGQYGTLTIGTNGAYSYAVDNSNATVNALLAGNVSEAFTYTVSDGKGGAASATLTVQINGSNDAPVAANDYGTAKEFLTGVTGSGYTATGNVLPNDTDVDAGDTKAINGLSLSGAATIGNVAVTQGATELIFIGGSGFNSVNAGQELYVSLTGAVGAGATYYGVYNFNGSTYTLVNVASKTTVTGGDAIQLNFDPTHYWNGSGYVAISNIGTFLSTYSNVLFENSTTQTENSNGGKEATVSSSSSLGYTTLSSLSGISGTVAVGMSVSGTGVPVGTKVSELVYSAGMLTSIKLDQELTATTGGGFTFSSSGATGVDLIGAHGKLNLAANGAYTYTPNTDNTLLSVGESAVEVFDYTMRDTVGVTSSAKLYITVYGSGTNDPVLTNDAVSATESGVVTGGNTVTAGTDATGNVLSNDKESAAAGTNVIGTAYVNRVGLLGSVSFTTIDTAANGRTTSQSAAVIGTYGTLTISDLGAYTYAINNANSTVNALLPGQALTETFVYEVKNTLSSSGPSWAKLVVTINGTNDAPVAVVDTGAVSEDNVLTNSGNVLTNDTDVDSGDTKTVSKAIAGAIAPTTAVTAGTTSVNGLSIGGTYGTLVLGADGTYLYTLATSGDATRYSALQALINGTVVNEVFTYEVKDTNGATSNATLTISVTGANEPPVNQFNGATFSSSTTTSVTTAMDTAITFTGSQLLSVADADNNLSRIVLNVDHGTLAVILSGAATISGGATGTAYLIISGTQVDINATLASLIYTPGLNFVGSDFLTIMSQDALNVTDSDGIAINIPTVFTGPTVLESDLASGSNAAGMGESATATLLAPSGQTFGATAQSGTDTYGTWTLNVGTGVFTYNLTSAPSVSGASSTRSINVTTYDATGNAVTNTVTVTVTDDVATANADVRSVTEGSTASPAPNITGNVYASGVAGDVADVMGADGSSNPVVKVIAGTGTPATAVAASSTSASGGTVVTGSYGTLTIGANGSYIYDLDDTNATVDALNTGSSLSEVFTYQIADGDGDVSNATLTITINGLSDGTPSLSINDVTVNEAAGTATFTVTRSGSSVATASVSYATSDGTATAGSDYTAITATTLNFAIGETSKTIAVSITDDSTAESSETFNVTLSAASGATISDAIGVGTITDNDSGNTAPVAKNNTYTATEDVLLTARNIITDNDGTAGTDSDAESNPLTIAKVNGTAFASLAGGTDPAHLAADGWKQVALTNGTLFIKSDGTTEYQPAVNSTAGDSFTYTASDGTAESGSATVSFSVTAVNDDYTDADETLSVAEDSAATTGNLLSGTSSVDGPVTIKDFSIAGEAVGSTFTLGTAYTVSGKGSITVNADGSYSFTPAANYNGAFPVVSYTTTDGSGTDDSSTLTVTVTAVADMVNVSNPIVNEASPYAVFTVTGVAGESVALSITAGSATATGTDFGAVDGTNLQVSTDAGTTWSNYSSAVTVPAGGSFLVRTPVIEDNLQDNGETFTLTATPTGGSAAIGTATLNDQGGGTIFTSTGTENTTATKTDDRPVTVTSPTVNEASPHAVFTVTGVAGQSITLSLSAGSATATGTDFGAVDGTNLQVSTDAGLTWSNYSSAVTVPAGGSFLVRTPVIEDNLQDNGETFTLTATPTGGSAAIGTATLNDQGGGTIFTSTGTENTTATKTDDTPTLSVSSPTVTEGESAVFTVSLDKTSTTAVNFIPALSNGTATLGADTPAASTLEVSADGGNTWSTVTGAVTIAAGQSSVQLRIATTDDAVVESTETFTLSTGAITGTVTNTGAATGTASITDNDVVAPTPVPEPTPVAAPEPTPAQAPAPTPDAPLTSFANFNSSILVTAASPLSALERTAEPIGDVRTSASGFQIVVTEAAEPSLSLFRGITDQFIEANKPATFSLPADAFVHTKADATVIITAKLADGRDLPTWIVFDARSGTFHLDPPEGFDEELQIKVVARDSEGREATAIFKLTVGEGKPKPLGRMGLSEQIMLAAKRSSPWLDGFRLQDGKSMPDKLPADRLKAAPAVPQQAHV